MGKKPVVKVALTTHLMDEVRHYEREEGISTTSKAAGNLIQKGMPDTIKDQFDKGTRIPIPSDMPTSHIGEMHTLDYQRRAEITKWQWMPIWVINTFENYELIKRDIKKKPTPAMERLKDHYHDVPAIICASGPSLDADIPFLKDWKGLLFCGPTQIQTLMYHGIEPDFLCAYDSRHDAMIYAGYREHQYKKTILITNPTISPYLLKEWKGSKLYYLPAATTREFNLEEKPMSVAQFLTKYNPKADEPISHYVRDEYTMFFRKTIVKAFSNNPEMHPGIHARFYNVGCTANNQVIMANFLGCRPIFMIGNDAGWHDPDKRRFTGYFIDPDTKEWADIGGAIPWFDGKYMKDKRKKFPIKRTWMDAPPKAKRIEYQAENGIWTTNEFMSYKLSLIIMSIYERMQIFECAHDENYGALNYFDRLEIAEVVEKQGHGYGQLYREKELRTQLARKYLFTHGQGYLVPSSQAQ